MLLPTTGGCPSSGIGIDNGSLVERQIRRYNYRKADYGSINETIKSIDWNYLMEYSTDVAMELFYKRLDTIIEKFTPKAIFKRKYPSWYLLI